MQGSFPTLCKAPIIAHEQYNLHVNHCLTWHVKGTVMTSFLQLHVLLLHATKYFKV